MTMWTLILHYADGTSEALYCTTREEARERARFYRTWTEGPRRVIRTTIKH